MVDWKGFVWKFIAFILIVAFVVQFFPLSNNSNSGSVVNSTVGNFSGSVSLNASISFFDGNNYVFCNSSDQAGVSSALSGFFGNRSLFEGSVPQVGLEFLVQASNYSTVVNRVRFALSGLCNPVVFREAGVQVSDSSVSVNSSSGLFSLNGYLFGQFAVQNGVVGSVNNLTIFGVPALIADSSALPEGNVSLSGVVGFANNSIQSVRLVQFDYTPSFGFVSGVLNGSVVNFTGFKAVLQVPWSVRSANFSVFNSSPSVVLNDSVVVPGNVSSVFALNRSFDGNFTVLTFPSNFTNKSLLNFSNAVFSNSTFTFVFNSSDSFGNVSSYLKGLGFGFNLYREALFSFNESDFLDRFGFYNSSLLSGLAGDVAVGDNLSLNVSGVAEDGVLVGVSAVQANLS